MVQQLDLQLPMQSVPIATNIASSNPTQVRCTLQHYVIKFVSDLQQVGSFFQVLWFPSPINWLPRYNLYIAESGVKHHNPNPIIPPYSSLNLHLTYFYGNWSTCFQQLKIDVLLLLNQVKSIYCHSIEYHSGEVYLIQHYVIKFVSYSDFINQ